MNLVFTVILDWFSQNGLDEACFLREMWYNKFKISPQKNSYFIAGNVG